MAKNPKITKKQIKREITAREAAKNLEAFGYTGGPQWASIDNFIKANPRARVAVTANKGAFVQSEALGFSNGGQPFIGATEYTYPGGITLKTPTAAKQQTLTGQSDAQEEFSKNYANYKRAISAGASQGVSQDYVRGRTDARAENFLGGQNYDTIASQNEAVPGSHDMGIYDQGLTSKQVGGVTLVGYQNEKDEFQPISYNDANRALAAGIVDLPQQDDGTEEDEGTEEDTTPDDTPPEETTPQPVLGCTDPNADNYNSQATQDDGSCVYTTTPEGQDIVIPVGPTDEEVEAAEEIFTDDGVVIPTGFDETTTTDTTTTDTTTELPATISIPTEGEAVSVPTGTSTTGTVQTPVLTGPEGTTQVPAQTFESNVEQQKEDFIKRGQAQAQLIQPQTRAEKIAAGVYGTGEKAGQLEQRLYRNKQGMSVYVLGSYNSNGEWNPTQSIPQGYFPYQYGSLPYLVQQAVDAPTTTTTTDDDDADTSSDVVNSQYGEPQNYFGGQILPPGYYAGPVDGVYKYGTGPYAEQTQAFLDSIGKTLEEFIASADWEGTAPNITSDSISANKGILVQGYSNGGQTVTVAGQELTKEQVGQAQQDLKAASILDPAGTAVAPPVTQINPDEEGTVLGATTGQALTTAPIVTDPAQVSDVTAADTPSDAQTTKAGVTTAKEDVKEVLDDVEAQKSEGPTKTIEAQTKDTTKISDLEAAQGEATKVEDAPTRTLQVGEMIDGSAVDQTKVAEAFGTGEVEAASVQDELTTLMNQFEGGNTPPWAAGAMRRATAVMAQRGLGSSSMAGQAIIQAAMEASLPIAQIDTANKQQMALAKAEQRAKFMQIEFDQEFQTKVMNAAKVSEIANMNFTADQQIALENAKMAQTMNLNNLSNKQALVMAEAAQLSQLEMASLSNEQQAQVQNAQNFLQIDMANLSNAQQTEIFKSQTLANTILSDTASQNATEQFNAANETQTSQFNATMKSQLNQFNSAQVNAMNQFNAGEANAIQKFNSELQNQREVFNATMYAQIAQANAKWRQDTTVANTAAINQSNFQFAKDVNGLTNKALDQLWQRERDLMSFAFTASESAMERTTRLLLGDKTLEGVRKQADAQEGVAKTSFIARLLFGNKGLNLFGDDGLLNLGGD